MKRLLVLKAGEVLAPVRAVHGGYERWFAAAFGQAVSLDVVPIHLGAALPALADADGVLMTGSPLSTVEPADWMKRAADWLKAAAGRLPVLGVCFGHQVLGCAFGARVVENPRGREIGTVDMTLTDEGQRDPLLRGVPKTFLAQATHVDALDGLPHGAVLLAGNESTPIQAMRLTRGTWGVQFHPEIDPGVMNALITARSEILERESNGALPRGERTRALLAGVRAAPAGGLILRNFAAML